VSDHKRLLEADGQRRQAMINADTDVLAQLLSDDLVWTHSSGKTESKAEVIKALAEGAVAYKALEMTQDRVLHAGGNYIHQGVLLGSAIRDGETKLLNARFLSVWQEVENQFQLVAWQSTNLS
jgi:ketosteroid isomerase-like protein